MNDMAILPLLGAIVGAYVILLGVVFFVATRPKKLNKGGKNGKNQ